MASENRIDNLHKWLREKIYCRNYFMPTVMTCGAFCVLGMIGGGIGAGLLFGTAFIFTGIVGGWLGLGALGLMLAGLVAGGLFVYDRIQLSRARKFVENNNEAELENLLASYDKSFAKILQDQKAQKIRSTHQTLNDTFAALPLVHAQQTKAPTPMNQDSGFFNLIANKFSSFFSLFCPAKKAGLKQQETAEIELTVLSPNKR